MVGSSVFSTGMKVLWSELQLSGRIQINDVFRNDEVHGAGLICFQKVDSGNIAFESVSMNVCIHWPHIQMYLIAMVANRTQSNQGRNGKLSRPRIIMRTAWRRCWHNLTYKCHRRNDEEPLPVSNLDVWLACDVLIRSGAECVGIGVAVFTSITSARLLFSAS